MGLPDRAPEVDAHGPVALFVSLVAVGAALYLTVGVVWLAPSTSFSWVHLALAAVTVVVAWAGAIGVLLDRAVPPLVAALLLFLLGFWQAVLWVFMVPAAFVLAVLGVVVGHRA